MPASDSGPPLRPEGLASDSGPPPDGLSDRKAWQNTTSDSDPRPQPGYVEPLLTALLQLAQSEPTGTNRPGTPAR